MISPHCQTHKRLAPTAHTLPCEFYYKYQAVHLLTHTVHSPYTMHMASEPRLHEIRKLFFFGSCISVWSPGSCYYCIYKNSRHIGALQLPRQQCPICYTSLYASSTLRISSIDISRLAPGKNVKQVTDLSTGTVDMVLLITSCMNRGAAGGTPVQ